MIINKHLKIGFTLAELLMALVIVGICSVLAMTTIKPQKKAIKYSYMNAYNTLEKAYYNMMLQGNFNPFTNERNGIEVIHTPDEDGGARILCEGLRFFLNVTPPKDPNGPPEERAECSATRITSQMANNFTNSNIQLISSNGMRFYISNMINANVNERMMPKFYLVFIDVNNEQQPNSITYTYPPNKPETEEFRIDPDIFAFALLENGRICPLGIPEIDPSILSASIIYADAEGNTRYTERSFSYIEAKTLAWGYYHPRWRNVNDIIGIFNSDEPFSMNDIIRLSINRDSRIFADITAPAFTNFQALVRERGSGRLASQAPFHCGWFDFGACGLNLDLYHY